MSTTPKPPPAASRAKSFKAAARPSKTPSGAEIAAFEAGQAAPAPAPLAPATSGRPPAMARLSVELPESLHFRFKLACLHAKTKMTTEMLAMIERYVGEVEARGK